MIQTSISELAADYEEAGGYLRRKDASPAKPSPVLSVRDVLRIAVEELDRLKRSYDDLLEDKSESSPCNDCQWGADHARLEQAMALLREARTLVVGSVLINYMPDAASLLSRLNDFIAGHAVPCRPVIDDAVVERAAVALMYATQGTSGCTAYDVTKSFYCGVARNILDAAFTEPR